MDDITRDLDIISVQEQRSWAMMLNYASDSYRRNKIGMEAKDKTTITYKEYGTERLELLQLIITLILCSSQTVALSLLL